MSGAGLVGHAFCVSRRARVWEADREGAGWIGGGGGQCVLELVWPEDAPICKMSPCPPINDGSAASLASQSVTV